VKVLFEKYFNLSIVIASGFVVAGQFYLEIILGLEPCNLCVIQKYSAQFVFFISLLNLIIKKIEFLLYSLISVGSVLGLAASGRQIFLQGLSKENMPDGLCDMPFEVVFQIYPFFDAIGKIFTGSSKCAEEVWSLLGLNIAEWSFIFFSSMLLGLLLRYLFINNLSHK
jgi:disulfide bond formation protein DsbB